MGTRMYLVTRPTSLPGSSPYLGGEVPGNEVPFDLFSEEFIFDFQFLKHKTHDDEWRLFDSLLDNKLYILPGNTFHSDEPGWFRIVFAQKPQVLKLGKNNLLAKTKNPSKNKRIIS